MESEDKIQNVFAYNTELQPIHISAAESGRKGYFCLGCEREMQAVKSQTRISYFRHDFIASKGQQKCTYSDETHRHKLAKSFLLDNKKVKVPALYKYPPKNIEGNKILISESKTIEADYVEEELYFYEDDNCEIKWGKPVFLGEKKYLSLKPDIVFFDSENKPILLIEIIATHKITEKKRLDLKRLGIDCIQISVPKESPENIEKTLQSSENTKWVYNYEQEITGYVPNPLSNTEGIQSIDEDQRNLFEESFGCRASQIRTLIQTITKCLGTEQYTRTKQDLESEISRVAGNTTQITDEDKQFEHRFEELRGGVRERLAAKHDGRRESIEREKRGFEEEDAKFRSYCVETTKEFNRNEQEIRERINGNAEEIRERINGSKTKLEQRYIELEEKYNRKNGEIERENSDLESDVEERRGEIEASIDSARKYIEGAARKIESIEGLETEEHESITRKPAEYHNLENGIREDFENNKRSIESEFRGLQENFAAAVKTRTYTGNGFDSEFKTIFDDIHRIPDFVQAWEDSRRYEKAWKCFTEGAYKNWINR